MTAESLAKILADIAVPLLIPVLTWLGAQLRDWHINTTILKAVARGAGAAYLSLVEESRGATPAAINRAVQAGSAYVEPRVADYLAKRGITTEALDGMVRAQLGTLLAADPGVKVGG